MKQIIMLEMDDLARLRDGETIELKHGLMLGIERVAGRKRQAAANEEPRKPIKIGKPDKSGQYQCKKCDKAYPSVAAMCGHLGAHRKGTAA